MERRTRIFYVFMMAFFLATATFTVIVAYTSPLIINGNNVGWFIAVVGICLCMMAFSFFYVIYQDDKEDERTEMRKC